jgi:signal transduction histidine kinase
MKSGTVTQRVVWALTGSVAIFVAALVLLAYLTFDQMEDGLVDQILVTEATNIAQRLDDDKDFLRHPQSAELGGAMQVWLRTAGQPSDIPPSLKNLAPGLHLLQPDDETWHVMVIDTAHGLLYVIYDATEHEARVHEFGLIVLGVGSLCIIAAYALSRHIASIAVAPLLELTTRLSNWAPGSPDIAITRDDEAGRLIEAFNRVQNQVDHSIAREREFAANLSHEARTPLAVIRSDCEIMLLNSDVPTDPKQRLNRIISNVDHIVTALESAQAIARDQPGLSVEVDLRACMDAAWQGLEAIAESRGLDFRNHIPPEIVRSLDHYALLTVLRNLIRNAIEHAAPATLTALLTTDGALELRDTGRGISQEELPFIFQRYYSRRLSGLSDSPSPSSTEDFPRGLGLAIAKRVCDMQGWELDVRSQLQGPHKGTYFTLRFV